MLYTFSKSQYDLNELQAVLNEIKSDDYVLLWQDGVLLAVKYPQFFANLTNVAVLEQDISARGLTRHTDLPMLSLADFVKLTEHQFPQLAF